MKTIRKLPANLVNKIAAGEVIERPASVVKELLENSIDAGADRVDVVVEEGGKKLIQVSDNGKGISEDDLPFALESHATSKLEDERDLFNVRTLGFRGEALASIASIARVEITSRPQGIEFGAAITAEGGDRFPVQPKGAPPGTTVRVENIFFNTPVRKKFMKTDSTEIGHISSAITTASLIHPEIGFTLTHNGRKVFTLPPVETVLDRIAALYGKDLARALITAHDHSPDIDVFALVGPAEVAQSSTRMQYIFVGGRAIRDRSLQHAVREAYTGFLPHGKHPAVFIYITIDPADVDVNVHPTKIEVRFKKQRVVYQAVKNVVRGALIKKSHGVQPHPQESLIAGIEDSEARKARIEKLVGQFIHRERMSAPAVQQERFKLTPGWNAETSTPSSPAEPPQGEESFADHFFQIHDSYIILETGDGLRIIDQHALHERILFEELRKRYESGTFDSQNLLIPEVLELDPSAMQVVEEHRGLFRDFGFEIEDFGRGSVQIRSVPQLLERARPGELVKELIDELADTPPSGKAKSESLDRLLKMMSCKAAVKAGQRLTRGEIIALLEKQKGFEGTFTCPHGRPTTIALTLEELEKKFHRR